MLDFSKYCEILIFDVAKQNNNTETSLNETVNVEFIKNSEKYFYKLWLEDVELYKEHSKIKQLSANWEMWLYDVTQTYFNKFAINCNNNNSLAVTELELLRERLFSSFEKFEKDMHGKYSYNTFYKEPKYLLDQASYFYGISESESYRLRSLLTKQSLFYSNFKINRNLPFMTYSEEDPMDKAMVSTKTSIDLDKQLEWSAYQYRVVIRLLKEVPKIWHEDHQEKAFEVKMDTYQDLVSALHSLQIFINQTDMTCLNLAQSSLIDFKSELAAQLAFKRNFLVKAEQNIREAAEFMTTILNEPSKMVKLGMQLDSYELVQNINITESFNQTYFALFLRNTSSIEELAVIHQNNTGIAKRVMDDLIYTHGIVLIKLESYELEQEDEDWFGTIVSGVLGVVQIIGGIALIGLGGPFSASFGMSMLISGISDCVASFISVIEGEAIDINSYFQSKAITYAIAVITAGIAKMTARINGELYTNYDTAMKTNEVLIAKSSSSLIGIALQHYALNMAVGYGVSYLADKIARSNDHDIEESAEKTINALISQNYQELVAIFIADQYNQYYRLKSELERKAFKVALECQKRFRDTLTTLMKATSASVAGASGNMWVTAGVSAASSASLAMVKLSGFGGEFKRGMAPYIKGVAQRNVKTSNNLLLFKFQKKYGKPDAFITDFIVNIDSSNEFEYNESKCAKIDENFEHGKNIKALCNEIVQDKALYFKSLKDNLKDILLGQLLNTFRDELLSPLVSEATTPIKLVVDDWLKKLREKIQSQELKKPENQNAIIKFPNDNSQQQESFVKEESNKESSGADSKNKKKTVSKSNSKDKAEQKNSEGNTVNNRSKASQQQVKNHNQPVNKKSYGDVAENYLNDKLLEWVKSGKTPDAFDVGKALIGFEMEMIGTAISNLKQEYPKSAAVLDKLLDLVNTPAEFAVKGAAKTYSFVKRKLVNYVKENFGDAQAKSLSSNIYGGEQKIATEVAKFAPTKNQAEVLKTMELVGLGKAAKEMLKIGAKALVKIELPNKEDLIYPATPVGHKGKEIIVQPGANNPTTILGREYSGHALDRMQERGLTPSMVEAVIKNGARSSGNKPNSFVHYDNTNKVQIVTANEKVITVIFGKKK